MPSIKPLRLGASLPYFLIPSAVFIASTQWLMPWLAARDVDLFAVFLIGLGGPLAMLLLATVIGLRREGCRLEDARSRLRLTRLPKHGAWYTAGLCLLFFLSPALLAFSNDWVLRIFPMPALIARLFDSAPGTFMGHELLGAWGVWAGFLGFSLLNVLGEELWWRGYLLPRQELALGARAWIWHGLLWAGFHSFFYWEVLSLLPGCLLLSLVAQRTRNTWPGIAAHFLIQVPTILALLAGVLRG